MLDDNDVIGVLDISNDEQDQGMQPKVVVAKDMDNDRGQGGESGILESNVPANASLTNTDFSPPINQVLDGTEKETRALKLLELKAKNRDR